MADVRKELLYMKSPPTRNFEFINHLQFNLPYFTEESLSEKLQLLSKLHKILTILLHTRWSSCHEILINHLQKLSLNSCIESGVFYIFMSCVNSLDKCVRINLTWHLKLLRQNTCTPTPLSDFQGMQRYFINCMDIFITLMSFIFTVYIPTSRKIFLLQQKYKFLYLYYCTVHLVDSLIITQPTNALFFFSLF